MQVRECHDVRPLLAGLVTAVTKGATAKLREIDLRYSRLGPEDFAFLEEHAKVLAPITVLTIKPG